MACRLMSDAEDGLQRIFQYASKDNQTKAVLHVLVCRCVKNYTIDEKITCLEFSRIEIFMNLQSCAGIGYFKRQYRWT
jgi:hypothetical protein